MLEVERFKFIAEWYHGAIGSITALESFRPEYPWIAKQLGIRSREVRLAVSRLQRLGLLEISREGWKRQHAHLTIPTRYREEASFAPIIAR